MFGFTFSEFEASSVRRVTGKVRHARDRSSEKRIWKKKKRKQEGEEREKQDINNKGKGISRTCSTE